MSFRSSAAAIAIAFVLAIVARPASAACVDWSVAAPTEPCVAFEGSFFHDIPGGLMRDGYLMKHLVSGSGHFFMQDVYVFDMRVTDQPLEVGHLWNDGSWLYDGLTGYMIEDVDGDHCVVSAYGPYGHGRTLLTTTPTGAVKAYLSTFRGKVSLHGDRAFQLIDDFFEWGIGVACLDISNPAAPATLGQLTGSFADIQALSDSMVLMRTNDGRLQVADFTTPASPVLRGSLIAAFTRWLGFAGGRVVVATDTATVGIDVSDPDAPYVAWSVPGSATAMTTDGDVMALGFAGTGATLALFDVGSVSPVPLSGAFGSEPSTSICVAISGNVLYTGGICAYDIADPENPQWLGQAGITCNSAGGIASSSTFTPAGDQLITPHGLVWSHCASVAGVPGPWPRIQTRSIRPRRSPSRPRRTAPCRWRCTTRAGAWSVSWRTGRWQPGRRRSPGTDAGTTVRWWPRECTSCGWRRTRGWLAARW